MRQQEFGYRIRLALDESAARLDYRTTFRLEQARKAALTRLQPERRTAPALALAGGPAYDGEPHGALWHSAWLAPLLAMVVGFVGIYQYQSAKRISDIADIDFAVLLDTTPISTYADHGLKAYLSAPLPEVVQDLPAQADATDPTAAAVSDAPSPDAATASAPAAEPAR
jgi:hypothetical protein